MNVWLMNLKDDRNDSNITSGDKFRFCKKHSVIGIGWADYDENKTNDLGLKKANNAIEQFNRGDLVWVRDIENDVYYICKITHPVKRRKEHEYNFHDLCKCCKCIFFRVGQNLPNDIDRRDLVALSTIQRANEAITCETIKFFKKLERRILSVYLSCLAVFLIILLVALISSGVFSSSKPAKNLNSYDYSSEKSSSYNEEQSFYNESESSYYTAGIFTEESYKSEWLKIQCVFAQNGLKATDPNLIEKYNNAQKSSNQGNFSFTEMNAYKNNENQSPYLQITVKKAYNESLQTLSDEFKDEIDSGLKKSANYPFSIETQWNTDSSYNLLGEEYLLQECRFKTFNGDELKVKGTYWFLHRIKDGYFISINCGGKDCSDNLNEILNWFEPLK